MNTENLIPIDFSRNITQFVPGDVYYNNFVDIELTMDQQDADSFNNADPASEFNTYFIVSFANRPNIGNQPVGDDVVVDAYFDSEWNEISAGYLDWVRDDLLCASPISKWKPNHEAWLKQFKSEQGKVMNTQDHKKAASGDQLNKHIELQVEEIGITSDLNVVISPDKLTKDSGSESKPFPSDYYLGDPPLKAGDTFKTNDGALLQKMDDGTFLCYKSSGKPIFTQANADAGEWPPVGTICSATYVDWRSSHEVLKIEAYIEGWVWVSFPDKKFDDDFHCISIPLCKVKFKPIDSRTDEEKLHDAVWESTELRARNGAAGVVSRLLSSDKFTITLN